MTATRTFPLPIGPADTPHVGVEIERTPPAEGAKIVAAVAGCPALIVVLGWIRGMGFTLALVATVAFVALALLAHTPVLVRHQMQGLVLDVQATTSALRERYGVSLGDLDGIGFPSLARPVAAQTRPLLLVATDEQVTHWYLVRTGDRWWIAVPDGAHGLVELEPAQVPA